VAAQIIDMNPPIVKQVTEFFGSTGCAVTDLAACTFADIDLSFSNNAGEVLTNFTSFLSDVSGTVSQQLALTSATAYPNTGWTLISPGSVEPTNGDFATWAENTLIPTFSAFSGIEFIGGTCAGVSSINWLGGTFLPYGFDADALAWANGRFYISSSLPYYPFYLGALVSNCSTPGLPLAGFPGAM
jgi:hypothetical protein